MEVWAWALFSFIPTIFVGPWYNGTAPSKSEDGLINDRCSALVGMARIRQLRVKNGKISRKVIVGIASVPGTKIGARAKSKKCFTHAEKLVETFATQTSKVDWFRFTGEASLVTLLLTARTLIGSLLIGSVYLTCRDVGSEEQGMLRLTEKSLCRN